MNTKDHGIPHSRRRWYCAGIREDVNKGTFCFPDKIPCANIERFLNHRDANLALNGLPPKSQGMARSNVKNTLRLLELEGFVPTHNPYAITCDSSPSRATHMYGVTPCFTCCGSAGHWITNRGHRLQKDEMMRLQGMDPTEFIAVVSDSQLGNS